ncbi:hypothetical protein EXIGLDRAFT_229075 [Exidia glandulosa HHB12029]|uniref:Uncharacterized protein n=1 Tax=Exidia glandulosa HHB12029 TaxID=1314781 RepID=A0A165E7V9_EXIGL|nr:hypothetical protein EXIGLDRAFT_229075 [Exidia glandulosa HHB12029]
MTRQPPRRKKGPARKRQERHERYIANLEANRQHQRVFATQRRQEERDAAAYRVACRDWDTMPFHARILILVMWDARRRAFKGVRGFGLDVNIHPNHGRNPSAHTIYSMYRQTLQQHITDVPLAFSDVCELLGQLVAADWIEFTRDGFVEDGSFVSDYDTLFQPIFPAGYIRNRLKSGVGERGDEVREIADSVATLCDAEAAKLGVAAILGRAST